MFGNGLRALSIAKVIGGITKTLNVANSLIPIYKEAKPMLENVRSTFNIIKEFGNTATEKINNNVIKNVEPIKEKISTIQNANLKGQNNPTFFQ